MIHLGTSGFAYKEWKPDFYPRELSDKGFLGYYAQHFDAVEVDYTFYRMPSAATLYNWQAQTPPHFRFTLKASQKITHFERLRLPSDGLGYWLRTAPLLGERLGMVFYQLPPNFKPDLERLSLFLDAVSAADTPLPTAFEFRHPGWFNDEVYAMLERHQVALVIHDQDEGCTPQRITAPRTYVRLRRTDYSDEERAAWAARLHDWERQGLDVYAFIKHEDNPNAPFDAKLFQSALTPT